MQCSTLFPVGLVSLSESVPAAVGVGGVPPAPAAVADAGLRLEYQRNNVTWESTGRVVAKPHRCRCRTCESCGPVFGRKVRARLIASADKFQHPALLTLTLKPSHFGDDPERAFTQVTEKRYIPRLMRLLGVRRWVWVLEFQRSGWPHWHLLIDVPGGRLDLKRAWELWGWNRSGWKLGGIDLAKQRAKDGRHAILYITKYLVKFPEHGFPDWVLDLPRRVRWVGASKEVGPVVTDRERTVDDVAVSEGASDEDRRRSEEASESLPVSHRPLRVRQSTCGQHVEFFRELEDPITGEIVLRFCGRLDHALFQEAVGGGYVTIWRDDDGTAWVRDPGDMRMAMSCWVAKALKRGAEAGSTRALILAARQSLAS